jgi:hypothetical protein
MGGRTLLSLSLLSALLLLLGRRRSALAVDPSPQLLSEKMATKCGGQRRLSELLQEQQEPFLVRRPVSVLVARSMLCGAKVVRKALLWDLAAGCFTACSDGGRQLRSVEEESTELSHCKRPASFLAFLHSPLVLCFTDLIALFLCLTLQGTRTTRSRRPQPQRARRRHPCTIRTPPPSTAAVAALFPPRKWKCGKTAAGSIRQQRGRRNRPWPRQSTTSPGPRSWWSSTQRRGGGAS